MESAERYQAPLEITSDDERYDAVRRRDSRVDGRFYYAVKTTGVYCRPSCGARLPKFENISFHRTPEDAESDGFRPCKRCRPRGQNDRERMADAITRVCAYIDESDETPTLARLAEIANLSPYHFHRAFTQALGVTPRRYVAAKRAERLAATVRAASRVTDATYDAGFASSSGFYREARRTLGMTPMTFRRHATGERIRISTADTSLGIVLVAATTRGLCAVRFGDDVATLRAEVAKEFVGATFVAPDAQFDEWLRAIVARIEGDARSRAIPLDLYGTVFQRRVWDALASIDFGAQISYGELAERLGTPTAVRAVAQAVAANPVAVVVPCHRVVGNDGSMRGYRWGVERKQTLLARERS